MSVWSSQHILQTDKGWPLDLLHTALGRNKQDTDFIFILRYFCCKFESIGQNEIIQKFIGVKLDAMC